MNDDDLRTWESLEHIVEDVPVPIAKYVSEGDGHHQLVSVHHSLIKLAKKDNAVNNCEGNDGRGVRRRHADHGAVFRMGT